MSGQARFEGKAALVTGAGSGIGRAVALRLTGEGAQVLAHDLNGDALSETAKLVADAGATLATRTGDISSRDECVATVAAAVDQFGKLDVLGNIAGIARAEHFPEVEERAYRQMMGVNVDACFFLAQAAIPHLLETEGNIVNIASNAGLMGQAYTVAYCMTKGAIVQLTKALAMEYAKTPLRVNAIAPGGVDTSLSRNFQMPERRRLRADGPLHGIPRDGLVRRHRGDVRAGRVRRGSQHPRRDPLGATAASPRAERQAEEPARASANRRRTT